MWVVIMTLAMLTAISYLIYFERHLRSSAAHFAGAVTADRSPAIRRRVRLMRHTVRRTSSRTTALAVVTVIFIISWYPLQLLTIIDLGFRHPFKVCETHCMPTSNQYRLFTSSLSARRIRYPNVTGCRNLGWGHRTP